MFTKFEILIACPCSVCVCVFQQGVHLAALLQHHCHCDRQLNVLPYKVKVHEVDGKEEGQEEPVNHDNAVSCWATGPA